jgi:hypothetical protein
VTQLLDNLLLNDHAAPGRECGACTACCSTLAIVELNKPARRACDHLCRAGCGIYDTRPASCREFHCLWLRGAIEGDVSLRPDALGVMFDYFQIASTGETHLIAYELWPGAFDATEARSLLDGLVLRSDVQLSYRDGRWSTLRQDDAPCDKLS